MAWHYVTTDAPGWTTPYSSDQTDNASEVWNKLRQAGWTENACAGVLGNFQHESYINPGQWEIGYNYSMTRGMGLGQWTPATKVSDFVGSTNHDAMANGDAQMNLLLSTPSQFASNINPDGTNTYYNESGLPYITSMAEYSQSTTSVDLLTKVWCICWERPGAQYYHNSIGARISDATYWYNVFSGGPVPPGPDPPGPTPAPDDYIIASLLMLDRVRYKR